MGAQELSIAAWAVAKLFTASDSTADEVGGGAELLRAFLARCEAVAGDMSWRMIGHMEYAARRVAELAGATDEFGFDLDRCQPLCVEEWSVRAIRGRVCWASVPRSARG